MNQAEKFWDSQARTYDASESGDEQTYSKIVKNTRPYIYPDAIVLDYACGTGSSAIDLADCAREIHGIDISSAMIDVATRKATERGIQNVHFTKATLSTVSYEPESFDVVTAFNILHLLEDTPEALQRIHNLLKPDGVFISVTACMGEKRSFLGFALSLLSKIRLVPYINMLSIADLEAAITQANFQITKTQALTHNPISYFVVAKKR